MGLPAMQKRDERAASRIGRVNGDKRMSISQKILYRETQISNGQEFDVGVTCCEAWQKYIAEMKYKVKIVTAFYDAFRRRDKWEVVFDAPLYELNFCPQCGSEIEKKVKE